MTSDQRAYLATKHVRHIGVWTAERPNDSWRTGCYRPLCGSDMIWGNGKVRLLWASIPEGPTNPWWTKPVCKPCLRVALVVAAAAMDVPSTSVKAQGWVP